MAQHVYLSPHLDDAVYSCGGLIARQTAAGESVTVLTICAGDPPPGGLTPFARELHARWDTEASPSAARRKEDTAACASLSAEVIQLEIPDAMYRKSAGGMALYPDETTIFGRLHKSDGKLVVHLQEILDLRIAAEAVVYCPLGYGGHVDHRLARRAAKGLHRTLLYYADLPYAMRGASIPDELGLPEGEKRVFKLDSQEMEAWVRACARYRSQLSTFWADEKALDAELNGFHGRQGGLAVIVPHGQ
jgi:LmbE family N-acetylglucosaminyl deacetylase